MGISDAGNGPCQLDLEAAMVSNFSRQCRRSMSATSRKSSQTERVAFYWIGRRGDSMLGLWEAGTGPQRMNLHVAFTVRS
jgi:hypothetical protein